MDQLSNDVRSLTKCVKKIEQKDVFHGNSIDDAIQLRKIEEILKHLSVPQLNTSILILKIL